MDDEHLYETDDFFDEDDFEDDFDVMSTIDLIDWNYDQFLAAGWDPGNATRGVSPSHAVLITRGPVGYGYMRTVIVPSAGMTPADTAEMLRYAAYMAGQANQSHPIVSEEPDGD